MTEETKKSSEVEEQELAQEALNATAPDEEETPDDETTVDETSPAEESDKQDVPVAKHAALRKRAQTAELEAANLRGQLTARDKLQATQTPPLKSPLELEIERQAAEGIAEEDMTITPRVYRAQQLHERQVANLAAETTVKEQLGVKQLASANKAKAAHEDWQEVVLKADGMLTKGELIDIAAAGDNFGELAYAMSLAAIERNVSETDTAPETKQSKSEAEAKAKAKAEAEAKNKVPTQQEILKDLNVDPVTEAATQL